MLDFFIYIRECNNGRGILLSSKQNMRDCMRLLKIVFLLLLIKGFTDVTAQEIQNDSINKYIKNIRELVNRREELKEQFLDVDYLLDKEKKVEGIDKVEVLLKLYRAYVFTSNETAKQYNAEALSLAINIGYKKGELQARYNKAYMLFVKGNFEDAYTMVEKLDEDVDYNNFPEVKADVDNLKSYIYTERGEYDLALEMGLKSLDIAEKMKNDHLFVRAYASLSHYYLRKCKFQEALDFCLKGLHYILKLERAYYIYPKLDEMARMSAKLNDVEGALEIYNLFLEIEKKMPPAGSYIQSVVYMNMADILIATNQLEKAQDYILQSLQMIDENNYNFRAPRALILQGMICLKNKDTANAIVAYEKSTEAAEEINAFDVVKSNSAILGDLYEKTKQLSKAYEYKTLYKVINDSLFTNEKKQKIIILEARQKIKEVTQKKKLLEYENKIQKAEIRTILIVCGFSVVFTIFIICAYLKAKEKNKMLYKKTLEQAEAQLRIKEKLQALENAKSEGSVSKNEAQVKTIDDDVKEVILQRLQKLENELFFIDSKCSLRMVAGLLKTNPKYLSQVINQEKKASFTNYINDLRIIYLLERLVENPEFRKNKLSYIAVSVGFNNLNTFNAAFKKRQGILPSYFISELIQDKN